MTEVFRKVNDRIEVSDLGRVRRNGVIVEPCHTESYDYIYVDSKHRYQRVHVLVAQQFPEICGEWQKYSHVHHQNGNVTDNRAENLVCISPSEHKRIHQKAAGVSKGVKAYKVKGSVVEKIGEWDSITQASIATGVDNRHIKNILSGKERRFTAGGYWWFLADEPEENISKKIFELQNAKYQALKEKRYKKT